jgi:hypothetical protein
MICISNLIKVGLAIQKYFSFVGEGGHRHTERCYYIPYVVILHEQTKCK